MAFLQGHGPVLRFRGRKRVVEMPLSKREMAYVAIFLLLMAVVLLLGMYISMWIVQEEEREWEHHDVQRTILYWVVLKPASLPCVQDVRYRARATLQTEE